MSIVQLFGKLGRYLDDEVPAACAMQFVMRTALWKKQERVRSTVSLIGADGFRVRALEDKTEVRAIMRVTSQGRSGMIARLYESNLSGVVGELRSARELTGR